MSESVALDSNHASVLLSREHPLWGTVTKLPSQSLLVPSPIRGELEYMVVNSTRQADNAASLQHLLDAASVIDFDEAAAIEYGQIRIELKRKGRPISVIDIQLAAIARVHDLTVWSADKHLTYVDGLRVENHL